MNSDYMGEFKENIGFILYLNEFFWKKRNKTILLASSIDGIYSLFVEDLSLYKKFKADSTKEKDIIIYNEPYIIEKNDNLILIVTCFYCGYAFFWDFNYGSLICKMVLNTDINDMCLYNNKYIIITQYNKKNANSELVFIDTNKNNIVKKINVENNVCGIKVLRHSSKGIFLISTDMSGYLKLYINKE